MTHAAAAMVRCLRDHRIAAGLLYGQGGFVTKHHAMVLATRPPATIISSEYRVQTEADRRRGPVPRLDENFIGAARVETYTIIYDRHGDAEYAVIFARTANGSRVLARVEREDSDTLAFLTDTSQEIIGTAGATRQGSEGKLRWVI
jgi:acetyl-CoA C-acetyltransferase